MTEHQLEVRDLCFRYGRTEVLHGLNLGVSSGEFVTFLGPSGCGKTTLLRLIAGLIQPSAGSIHLDGDDITRKPPERRPLNMVFQHLALFPHLSVEDNIGFSLSLQRAGRSTIRRRVDEVLALVGLSGYGDRSISQLSGGQQQRVAIARAVITEPAILLLDEPLGALDLMLRKEMQNELKSLQRRLGITFILVTHDQTEAMSMSDRIVLMKDGHIIQDAGPRETYNHPVDAFAATFVGDTNLLVGTVEMSGVSRIVVDVCGLRVVADVDIGADSTHTWHSGDRVAASIRPERLVLRPEATGGDDIPGIIELVTFLGSEVVVDVRTELGILKVREPASTQHFDREVGQATHLSYAPSHVQIFHIDDSRLPLSPSQLSVDGQV